MRSEEQKVGRFRKLLRKKHDKIKLILLNQNFFSGHVDIKFTERWTITKISPSLTPFFLLVISNWNPSLLSLYRSLSHLAVFSARQSLPHTLRMMASHLWLAEGQCTCAVGYVTFARPDHIALYSLLKKIAVLQSENRRKLLWRVVKSQYNRRLWGGVHQNNRSWCDS